MAGNARQAAHLDALIGKGWTINVKSTRGDGQLVLAGVDEDGEAFTGRMNTHGAIICHPTNPLALPGFWGMSASSELGR